MKASDRAIYLHIGMTEVNERTSMRPQLLDSLTNDEPTRSDIALSIDVNLQMQQLRKTYIFMSNWIALPGYLLVNAILHCSRCYSTVRPLFAGIPTLQSSCSFTADRHGGKRCLQGACTSISAEAIQQHLQAEAISLAGETD